MGAAVEFYTDKDSMFTVNRPMRQADGRGLARGLDADRAGAQGVGVGWIAAHSPQAKGRIERFFGTAQDRLVKGMRKAGVRTLEEANAYLEHEYLPLWNRRFTVQAEQATDAHRPLRAGMTWRRFSATSRSAWWPTITRFDTTSRSTRSLARIFVPVYEATVRVEERRDQRVWVRFRDRYLKVSLCDPEPQPTRSASPARGRTPRRGTPGSTWMKEFHLRKSPPLWKIMQQEQAVEKQEKHPLGRVVGANLSRPTGSFA